jgi:hypothetical protein
MLSRRSTRSPVTPRKNRRNIANLAALRQRIRIEEEALRCRTDHEQRFGEKRGGS